VGQRIAAATKSYDACPASHLAESQLGDAIYANMIMLGFAWQKGVIPISSRALYRAIQLNGVEAEANLQAFELGRKVAFDPSARGPRDDDVPTPQTMPLDDLIAHRVKELTAYQNRTYADRYLAKVERVRAAEAPLGSDQLTRAVAVSLYKLMAYKDEYEVARLYSDGRFAAYRAETFKGGKAKVWLAPPLLARKGPDGKPVKMAFSPWMLDLAFPTLAKLKGLRGGPLDIFGMTAERKMERGLIAEFEADLERILAGLDAAHHHLAVKLAEVPQQIRGFGHVKDASLGPARAEAKRLWKQWEGVGARETVDA
jgi:indolepyruvate ferredoxin oxidoreductase